MGVGESVAPKATGRLPFQGESDVESLSATITQEAAPLSEVLGEVPPDAERLVRKALEKDPSSRYQHADEIVTDLSNLDRDLASGRISRTTDTVPPVRERSVPLRQLLVGAVVVAPRLAKVTMKTKRSPVFQA